LTIELPATLDSAAFIYYSTSPNASGLLAPEQRRRGKQPFMQAQAIHARSFIPIQIRRKCASRISAEFARPRICSP